jgi:hypothetical protein
MTRSLKHSAYHKVIRSGAVVTALLFAVSSGAVVPDSRVLVGPTERYLANVVGMSASVAPNELNTLASELSQRADELERREREIDARARGDLLANPITTYTLGAILVLQLLLIVANYVLDYRRSRSLRAALTSRTS